MRSPPASRGSDGPGSVLHLAGNPYLARMVAGSPGVIIEGNRAVWRRPQ